MQYPRNRRAGGGWFWKLPMDTYTYMSEPIFASKADAEQDALDFMERSDIDPETVRVTTAFEADD